MLYAIKKTTSSLWDIRLFLVNKMTRKNIIWIFNQFLKNSNEKENVSNVKNMTSKKINYQNNLDFVIIVQTISCLLSLRLWKRSIKSEF